MNYTKNIKKSRLGLVLLSKLSEAGKKIFTTSDVVKIAPEVGISIKYVPVLLSSLRREEWILPIRKGIYALSKGFSTEPLHEFEIAGALVESSTISHFSALHYHGLTDQIPQKIYVTTTMDQTIPRSAKEKFGTFVINGVSYVFSRVKKERFFGIQHIWVNDTKVHITNPEKTLLDGLAKPQYCGGFDEVFHAFQLIGEKIDLKKIISYAFQLDTSIVKRLGWVLANIGFEESRLKELQQTKVKGYRKLNASGSNLGPFNAKWMIRENFYG